MLIRNKLMLWFTTLVAIILVFFSLFTYYFYSLYRQQAFYVRLGNKVTVNAKLMLNNDKLNDEALKYMRKEVLTRLDSEKVSIYGSNNTLLYFNTVEEEFKPYKVLFPKIKTLGRVEWIIGDCEALGVLFKAQNDFYFVLVSAKDTEGINKLNILKNILILANLISILMVSIAGWLFARTALDPISRVIREVNVITALTLDRRVDEGNKRDEIARLAFTFNNMLQRIQQAYETRKSFVSNASHELRTPLTNLMSELETSYLYDRGLSSSKESIRSAIEEIKKLIVLTNGLLSLAKVEDSNSQIFYSPVSLDDIVLKCIDEIKKVYPLQEITFDFGIMQRDLFELEVNGNEDLLKTAIGNVIENACKYSNGTGVAIILEVDKVGSIMLSVQDHGLGMNENVLKHLTEPLFRGDNVKNIPGHGIGLSLTQKIIDIHNGRLLFESEEEKGTLVKIMIPSGQKV